MSHAWLEGLSEEWVPQPTPSAVDPHYSDQLTTQISHSVPPKPQSRLPRMRHSSGSFSEIQVRQVAKDLQLSKRRSILADRSLSDNNIPAPTDASEIPSSRYASRSFSAASIDSGIYDGTVAQKPAAGSPSKSQPDYNTPEWRRRLLKGEVGYGDQKDLFSPMGLENIFQKPTSTNPEEKQPRRKLGMLKNMGAMPSSPPPWPEAESRAGDFAVGDQGNSGSIVQQSHSRDNGSGRQDSLRAPSGAENSDLGSVIIHPAQRTISGQIEFENENFSPVYLTTNLKVGATPSHIPNFRGSELANRLRHLGSPQLEDGTERTPEGQSVGQPRDDSSFARLQDDSLPEGLPAGTPDLADIGRFVEMRRGGYSRDGSFRRRPLSPSPQRQAQHSALGVEKTSQVDQDENLSLANEGPDADEHLAPRTPHGKDRSKRQSPERTRSSGSPLKLFDAHDTFTSNRLQRRLSQLDDKLDKTSSSSAHMIKTETTKIIQTTSKLTSVEEVSIQKGSTIPIDIGESQQHRQGTFGRGELNQYQFSGDFSMLSSAEYGEESAPDESPSMDVPPPGSRMPLKFQYDASPISREPSRARRQGLTRISNPLRNFSQAKPHQDQHDFIASQEETQEPAIEYAEGKRGPTSPSMNPKSKRRRTKGEIEDDDDETGMQSIRDSHASIPSIIGRKRKDARHEHSSNIADPEVLARRHILRPRNPTPSQKRLDEIHAEILEATDAFIQASPKMESIREHIESVDDSESFEDESRAAMVANEVAAFSMRRQQMARDQTRKRSVTTQDFLDEAVKIMDYIRAKGRPASGLGSLEETEAECHDTPEQKEYPSSSFTFDRPPSREGRMSAWKEPNKKELDPQVMSHLRKFQEKESDEMLGSSFHSLRISRMKTPVPQDDYTQEDSSIIAQQDDIRIIDNRDRHASTQEDDAKVNSQPLTSGTNLPTSSSMGQTIASRRSDHVATLPPEAVAHLIPKEIAGMSFDHEKNIWVRRKPHLKEQRHDEGNSGANDSEDDPFGNIPDLTVDESAERIANQCSPTRPQATAETMLEDTEEVVFEDKARPMTREGQGTALTDSSSVPSKVSNFAWSFPKTETRATSWSDQGTRNGGTQKVQPQITSVAIPESEEDDVEHEIQYFEGRGTAKSAINKGRVRDITISIAERDFVDATTHLQSNSPTKAQQRWTSTYQNQRKSPTKTANNRGAKTMPRTGDLRRPGFCDDDELPTAEGLRPKNYRMQLSMSVAAPIGQRNELMPAPSSPAKADVTFMLSDLPEFTLNQIDECELPERHVIQYDGHKFSKALEDRYALGTADLVKALQDVEPDEPYWEDLLRVDLHGKQLTNVHRLDEFCCRLDELNISNNSISQTRGIPYTTRRLEAQQNCFTSLTSWTLLTNLHYLDISGNDIDNLDGLSDLVHLRTLKADDNKIKSLEGIFHLDGLMELSVARNELEVVDFSKSNLKYLSDVDMRGNRLYEVRSIHCLPELKYLNLDDNCIEEFPNFDEQCGRCKSLRSLRICNNGTSSLKVDGCFPKLESLHVDRNALTTVDGLDNLRYLRTFSAREQTLDNEFDSETCIGNMVQNTEVRNLYLSLNPTHGLDLSQHLLSLQRLELASMGLKELPGNLGQLMPNIRSVNLNFNSISDLRPLLNIKRLDELLLAGNKLTRLRTNAMVLGKLTTLSKLDWRDNPLSLRFYASASENRVMSLRQKPAEEQLSDRFVLPDGDEEADIQYLLRLDKETRLRRRVTEMLLANLCTNLRQLDGLPFDKSRILVKDDVWERLLYLGVIQKRGPHEITES